MTNIRFPKSLYDFVTNKQLIAFQLAVSADLRGLQERITHIETFLQRATSDGTDTVDTTPLGGVRDTDGDGTPEQTPGSDGEGDSGAFDTHVGTGADGLPIVQ